LVIFYHVATCMHIMTVNNYFAIPICA